MMLIWRLYLKQQTVTVVYKYIGYSAWFSQNYEDYNMLYFSIHRQRFNISTHVDYMYTFILKKYSIMLCIALKYLYKFPHFCFSKIYFPQIV